MFRWCRKLDLLPAECHSTLSHSFCDGNVVVCAVVLAKQTSIIHSLFVILWNLAQYSEVIFGYAPNQPGCLR